MNVVEHQISDLEKGISLFNEGKYFEAHEAWEKTWLSGDDQAEKDFTQGLIMTAGSFQHYLRRECRGALTLLEMAIPKIDAGIKTHPKLRLSDFVRSLDSLKDEFSRCSFRVAAEDLPRIARMYIYC